MNFHEGQTLYFKKKKTAYLGLGFKALAGITFLQFVLAVLTAREHEVAVLRWETVGEVSSE